MGQIDLSKVLGEFTNIGGIEEMTRTKAWSQTPKAVRFWKVFYF